MSIEEQVHGVQLKNNIDQVEELTEDELASVDVVFLHVPVDVVCDEVPLCPVRLLLSADARLVEVLQQGSDLTSLHALPDEVGQVTHHSLEI